MVDACGEKGIGKGKESGRGGEDETQVKVEAVAVDVLPFSWYAVEFLFGFWRP